MTWREAAQALETLAMQYGLASDASPFERTSAVKAAAEALLHELCHAKLLGIRCAASSDRVFDKINEMTKEDADLHEIDTLAVEYLAARELGLRGPSLRSLVEYASQSLRSERYGTYSRAYTLTWEAMGTPRNRRYARLVARTINRQVPEGGLT